MTAKLLHRVVLHRAAHGAGTTLLARAGTPLGDGIDIRVGAAIKVLTLVVVFGTALGQPRLHDGDDPIPRLSHGDASDGERTVDDDQDEQRDGDVAGETGSEQTAGPGTHGTASEFAVHPLGGVAREEMDEPEHGHDDDGGSANDAGAHDALGSMEVEHEHEG